MEWLTLGRSLQAVGGSAALVVFALAAWVFYGMAAGGEPETVEHTV